MRKDLGQQGALGDSPWAADTDSGAIKTLDETPFALDGLHLSAANPFEATTALAAPIITKSGAERLVNTSTAFNQTQSSVSHLTDGGYVVVWTDGSGVGDASGTSVKGQRFDASGNPVGGEFLVNTTTTNAQDQAAISGLSSGGWVVTWRDASLLGGDSSVSSVKAQIFAANGTKTGGEFLVNTTTFQQQFGPAVLKLANGNFVISWTDYSYQTEGPQGSAYAVHAQIFSQAGAKIGSQFLVNTYVSNHQDSPSMAALDGGGFVIAWESFTSSSDFSGYGIFGQRYDVNGTRVGSEFMINTATLNDQTDPVVTSLVGGGFAVAWRDDSIQGETFPGDFDPPNPGTSTIKLQIFNSAGAKSGGEIAVESVASGQQQMPAITTLADGTIAVSWADPTGDSDVKMRLFDPSGTALTAETIVNTTTFRPQSQPSMARLTNGNLVITWTDESALAGDTSGTAVRSQTFQVDSPAGSVSIADVSQKEGNSGPTSFSFTLTRSGGTGAFTVDYATANGTASAGSDYIASTGTLSFAAGETSKTVTVLVNGDTQHESSETFNVTLGNPATNVTIADGAAVGTILDDDATGDSGNNTLTGTGGADTFYLQQGGDDTVSGGAGNDIFYYGGALTAADQNDGGTDIDTLVLQGNYNLVLGAGNVVGIEGISLQSGSITRWGDTAGNLYDFALTTLDANVAAGQQMRINGQSLLAGEDLTFNGSAESDGKFLVYGGFGVDTLTGGAGGDVFFFEAGRFGAGDTVNGGPGNDAMVISGSSGSALLTVNIASGSMTSIEALSFNGRFQSDPTATPSYNVTLQNGNIAPGAALIVNGSSLGAAQSLTFNGSAETNGQFSIFGGAGNDTLTGGGNNDVIYAAGGADQLMGGGGADTFRYDNIGDSTSIATDHILDFNPGTDKADFSRIDADSFAVGNQAFHWIGANAFSGSGAASAGELRAYESAGDWYVEGDVNGDGAADMVVTLTTLGGAPIGQGDLLL